MENVTFILIVCSVVEARASLSVRAIRRILSMASEALEINSRKKICTIYILKCLENLVNDISFDIKNTSLLRYRELMMSFIIRFTSAWKANFSDFSLSSLT